MISRTAVVTILLFLCAGLSVSPGFAQDAAATSGPPGTTAPPPGSTAPPPGATAAPPGATAAPGSARPADAFPKVPRDWGGFFRGTWPPGMYPMESQTKGFYFDWFGLIFVVGIAGLWVWTCGWVNDDAHSLKVRPEFWNGVLLVSGVFAIMLALVSPNFFVAFLAVAAGYGAPTGVYVTERNRRVPEASKVLTPRHLKTVFYRILARLGISMVSKEVRDTVSGPPIRLIGKSGKGAGEVDRSRQVETSRGYLAARELIYDAIMRRGTDLHLEPKEGEMSVRIRIDGVMHPAEPFDRATGDSIVNIFKVLSSMDITERRRPQDGSFRAEMEDREIDFRVATQGVQAGEKMSIRILDQSAGVKSLADLGLRKQLADGISDVIHQPHGMFLSCGPTGAGKSTTLYAALREIDAFENNIITIEDPVEYKAENVTQIEINTKANQTFATALRSVLRQDPDVVMIGEIRDGETAKIACQAANTGHMVFSTVHANDTTTALSRLIDLGVESFLLADSISAILGQRLVRKLCEDCKVAYKPSVDELQKAGLPAGKVEKFYRPPPADAPTCPSCNGIGYLGRIGVFELFVVTDRIRDLIREGSSLTAIKAEARKGGMLYMREEGLRLVVRGTTSLEELLRVVK
ncbi:MAG: type II/IV secretion system protein [Planctomycetaceae bacterium]|nr:type II/IV secretion system protein [Planctomycetaceae bacterium]